MKPLQIQNSNCYSANHELPDTDCLPLLIKALYEFGRFEEILQRTKFALLLINLPSLFPVFWLIDVFWKFEKENPIILFYISVVTPVSEQLARRRARAEGNYANIVNKLPEKIENKLMKKGHAHHMFSRFLNLRFLLWNFLCFDFAQEEVFYWDQKCQYT